MAKQAHDAGVSADTFKVLARLAWHDTKPARPVEVRS
jgi:hypothetical protein